jgi:energy-coupling factor transport system ATP-binding protein
LSGTAGDVFVQADMLESIGLGAPQISYLIRELNKNGFCLDPRIFTVDGAHRAIMEVFK